MTQQDLVITTEDIQTVLRSDPNMALRVQNQALMRKLAETQAEVDRLTQELEQTQMELHDIQNDYASGRRDN